MTNSRTASDTGVNAGSAKDTGYRFPGHAMQSHGEPESLSDEFNDALGPWIGRFQAAGGSRIGKSRFAAHDMAIDSSKSARRQRAARKIVKVPRMRLRQAGFFDLGISLLILALSGSAVYAIEKTQAESVASTAENAEVSANRPQGRRADKVAKTDADVAMQ